MSIEVRPCATLDEFDECVRIQQIIWGHDLAVPTPIFVVAQDTGGQVLGAFHDELMIGFALAVVGVHRQEIFLHSHMAAVLPKYQNQGVGRKLKLAQREAALARGIDLIEWTFDPLELKNAHFNLVRLGAVARRYIPNCYGITSSPLHAGLPTDRLVAEWRLSSERVYAVVEEKRFSSIAAQEEAGIRISVPADIGFLKERDAPAAEKWQREIRQQFQQCFEKGYIAVGVKSNKTAIGYILAPESLVSSQLSPRQSAVGGRR
jgi:predicted GNAT superfamily acetyltransferase